MKQILLLCFFFLPGLLIAQNSKRALRPGDIYRLKSIGDPQISPEGDWVAFTVSSIDSAKDKRNTDIWMVNWKDTSLIQLTNSPDAESNPRWSPDGKYLAFTAARQGGSSQIWVLDRRGGEGIKLTDLKGDIADYDWSPDGKKIALIIRDPVDTAKSKPPKPYIINRYRFKQDVNGYLYESRYTHLYLFNVATKKLDTLTRGLYNETDIQWSPDGSKIAFVSNQSEDPDKNSNSDIWIIDAKAGAQPKKFTTWLGSDHSPQWSPDGKSIAYLRSTSDENYIMYDQPVLCLADASGAGEVKLLSKSLDRPVSSPRWSTDGKSIAFLVTDDLQRYVGSYDINTGKMQIVSGGDRSFTALAAHPKSGWITSMSQPHLPAELYAIEHNNLRRLTSIQNSFVDSLSLASVEKFVSKSKDGNLVSGLLYLPPNAPKEKLPLIFYIHGGPVGQDEFTFDMTRQMFAAKGYAVAAVNYRGSNGRGLAYSKAIYADWGNKEVLDILGACD
ncbi:MAG: DPP IV N-terminal domain-containing protein, partial [Bacteroidota bacterium]|nr:DPP IV N-terminal domain-containing protein [Bacteroidota bacterium]